MRHIENLLLIGVPVLQHFMVVIDELSAVNCSVLLAAGSSQTTQSTERQNDDLEVLAIDVIACLLNVSFRR